MSSAAPRPPFRVQIVSDPQLEYFRTAELGARHYGFERGRLVFVDRWLPHEVRGDLAALVRRDRVDGIVAALHSQAQEARFRALPVPVVNISNSVQPSTLPVVTQDDVSVGRLAAEHLQLCGCSAFGFWGHRGAPYSEQRLAGFRAALAAAGLERTLSVAGGDYSGRGRAQMRRWLAALPRPVGIFVVLDTLALCVMRTARDIGARVPEEIAVLGTGNDDFWVEFESVPLSSVRLPARQIGYEAAALLDRLITTRRRQAPDVRLPVNDISARRSTDIVFLEDQAVSRALRYIREHATENPYVDEVARVAGISRSGLQTRFRAAVGRSVVAEILRFRVRAVERLLAESDLPMSLVAERCGFTNSQRLSLLFRRCTGQTPSAYRRRFRLHAGGPGTFRR